MQEKQFIQQGARRVRLHEFLEEELDGAGYSRSEIERTPTSTKIVVHAEKPGLVIGRGGSRIRELTEDMEEEFDFENPQIEVDEIENPDADAEVAAKGIANWLEKGGHAKRVGFTYLRRIKDSGAIGAEIEVTGKLSGNRGRTEKFSFGYVKRCGNTSKENVSKGYELARTRPGAIGVKVRIMDEMPQFLHRNVDVSEEVLHLSTGEGRQKEDRIHELIVEADDMTSASLEDALESKEDKIRVDDISKEEIRDTFESVEDMDALKEEYSDEASEAEEPEETQTEESDSTESEPDQSAEDIVSGTIADAKDAISELDDPDFSELMEAESDGKNRKTFKSWLEERREE